MALPTEYWPTFYPTVTSQWFQSASTFAEAEAASCVANALATCFQVFRYHERGLDEQYSHMFIYGNRLSSHQQNEWLQYDEVLDMMITDGTPAYHDFPHPGGRHSVVSSNWYNSYYGYNPWPGYQSAKELTTSKYNDLIERAMGQRINYIDTGIAYWYSVDGLKQEIYNNKAVLQPMCFGNDFYNIGYDGVVPNVSHEQGTGVGHAVVLLGWRVINGKVYWIAQNSWGDWWGDNGRFYIAHDHDYLVSTYDITLRPASPKLNAPKYVGSSVSGTSITLSYESVYGDGTPDPKPNSWHVRCRLGSTGSGTIVEDKYVSNPGNIVFSGLTANATYNFVCCARGAGFTDSEYTDRIVLTTKESRPPKFYWTYPKAQGGTFNLTASEWNGLCANVNLVEQYKGRGKSNFAVAYMGNNVRATMFNEVRFAIGSINSTGIGNKYTGDTIRAIDMNTIVSKLNEIE